MRRIIVFTALDETNITFRHYQAAKISEGEIYNNKLDLQEIGPHFNMKLRRFQLASNDLYKTACKKPKIINVEKKRVRKIRLMSVYRQKRTCIQLILERLKEKCSFNNKT